MIEGPVGESVSPVNPAVERRKLQGVQSAYRRIWALSIGIGAFISLVLVGRMIFGSIPTALRYARGERLILEPSTLKVEGLNAYKSVVVSTEIRNYSPRPIRLLGSATNCTCISVSPMPREIAVGGSVRVSFATHAPSGKSNVDQNVVLFTDDAEYPQLIVHVLGVVRN